MTKCNKITLFIITIGFLIGCSKQQMYDSIHAQQKSTCSRQSNTVYQECLDSLSKPYEEYEYERNERIETN
ncbi:hypothetical protein L3V77_21800 [Vibrio sp. DW001]|uniref:hypothetical protein n=1 Tax=Vibrio sp. DW001 TaxID=2912315 RepID=UPI0023AF8A2E|nr:hypothetical protein [Vibrio sp. DW001]WED28583.1 hypothetical protein L3V77_21800 [Vibrio sp. DW001]